MICSSCILNRGAQEDSFIAKRQLSFLTLMTEDSLIAWGKASFVPLVTNVTGLEISHGYRLI